MAGGMSTIAREELIRTIRSRYRESTKMEKSRILDELAAVVGCHRKHAIRLLGLSAERGAEPTVAKGRRIYDEAVREALIVVWEASDRICGKRLKAVLPSLIEAMERHGHLDLDPHVRQRLVSASPATIDRLLKPIRETAGGRRKRRVRRKRASRQVPVRTFADWNAPPQDSSRSTWSHIAAGHSRALSSTAWSPRTYARGGPKRSRSWRVSSRSWSRVCISLADRSLSPSVVSTRTTTAYSSTRRLCNPVQTVGSSSPVPGHIERTTRLGSSRRTGPSSADSSGMTATQARLPVKPWLTCMGQSACT